VLIVATAAETRDSVESIVQRLHKLLPGGSGCVPGDAGCAGGSAGS